METNPKVGGPALREHLYLGNTQSLCPDCLRLVQAKIVAKSDRVYFEKFCPEHGTRLDFVCSDVRWWDRMEFNVPGRQPRSFGTLPTRGCPYDCGLCTAHEQHTCIGLLEITSYCNLTCPVCYASSGPDGRHLTVEQCRRAIDRLVAVEGRAEIVQLSGGEPTIHPQFAEIFDYACDADIDLVMINTNGIRLAQDRALCELLAARRARCQVYLQVDSLRDDHSLLLRGESLLNVKLRALERLGEYGINTTLVATLEAGINDDQIGPLVAFAQSRAWITGVSFQPTTYVGRCPLPRDLDRRVTFPDVIRAVEHQTRGAWRESDFFPVPCAHPNTHTLAYAFRSGTEVFPIARWVDIEKHYDLLANGISLTRQNTRQIVAQLLEREVCGGDCGCFGSNGSLAAQLPASLPPTGKATAWAGQFFQRALAEDLSAADMFRITTTSFMDAYNFDIRQIIKSCVHQVLPSGHLIPFCAYNLFYRDGRVALPALHETVVETAHVSAAQRTTALPIVTGGP